MPKILAIRLDRIGDIIQTLPAFYNLDRLNADYHILCHEQNASLFYNSPLQNKVILFSPNKPQEAFKKIKSLKFDIAINFAHDINSRHYLAKLKKIIPLRIGNINGLSAFFFYNKKIWQHRSKAKFNEAYYCIMMLSALFLNQKIDFKIRPQILFSAQELIDAQDYFAKRFQLFGEFIILIAGSGRSGLAASKGFNEQLLKNLLAANKKVVLTGTTIQEQKINSQLYSQLHLQYPQLYNLTKQLNLRKFMRLVKLSKLLISPSTGGIHIANACNTYSLGIYPPIKYQTQKRWGPYLHNGFVFSPNVECPEKYKCRGESCKLFFCMDNISPVTVAQKAISYLSDSIKNQ